ncbi:reverse transcriptase domain-containing protein [Tanacetum coccineum]
MSSPNHPTSDIEDAFSFNFTDYFPASPGNTSSKSSNNSSGLVPIASPTLSLFHNDPYMKVMQAYNAIKIPPPKDTETPDELPIPISPSSSVGSSSPIRSTTPPPDYPFDESIFAEMPLKRKSTSAAPVMTQAAIKKLVADSVSAALEAQAVTMVNADNTNRNTREREALIARKCSYKEFMSCQPIKFKGSEGAWDSFAQPIGIEETYKITWVKFKKLLIKKYYPRTKVQKMEDEFYHLTVKGNGLKTYVRRFRELATLCPTMVPNTKKNLEAFIEGLPRSIEGNVTASKPQTLEEAINITQRLMDQVTRHNSFQGTNDHKRKFDDRRTFNNNNY